MKVAITGTTSGIGLSTAGILESEGYDVLRLNRQQIDFRFLESLKSVNLKGFDILINNAATQTQDKLFKDITKENIIEQVNVNLLAPMMLTHSFINQNNSGTIINITSGIVDDLRPKEVPYYVTKSGLSCFTKAVNLEEKLNFRFVEIVPRRVKSRLTHLDKEYQIDPVEVARLIKTVIENQFISEIKIKDHRR